MLILDAGAFLAAERGDDDVAALVKRERKHGRVPLTNGGVVAQVWRGGNGKQADRASRDWTRPVMTSAGRALAHVDPNAIEPGDLLAGRSYL